MKANRPIKGPARALRCDPLRVRESQPVLGRHAEEQLFQVAEVLSEGGAREGTWFGSTMITVDLDRLAEGWRGEMDSDAKASLAKAVDGSVRVRIRAMRLARAEVARRLPDRNLGTAQVETHIRLHNGKLHVDVDLEVPLSVSSGRRKRRL